MTRMDSLGDRMKGYENVPKVYLTLGSPKVIRLDMRAGHSFCRDLDKPFDDVFSECMRHACRKLCESVPGVVFGYTQSDEISLFLDDATESGYECFFNGSVEKIVSVTASIATLAFNEHLHSLVSSGDKGMKRYADRLFQAQFDSRVFCLPTVMECFNYLLWRVMDAKRNSVSMVGRSVFSQQELSHKSVEDVKAMLFNAGAPWDDVPLRHRYGSFCLKERYAKMGACGLVLRTRWTAVELEQREICCDIIDELYDGAVLFGGDLKFEEEICLEADATETEV